MKRCIFLLFIGLFLSSNTVIAEVTSGYSNQLTGTANPNSSPPQVIKADDSLTSNYYNAVKKANEVQTTNPKLPNNDSNFPSNASPSNIEVKFPSDKELVSKADNAIRQFIPIINQWFGVNLKTEAELENFIKNKIKFYYSNLRNCTPGTYQYPLYNPMGIYAYQADKTQPLPLYYLTTVTISGSLNNFCEVTTSVKLQNQSQVTKCNYTPEMLSLFTDKMAESFYSKGALALSNLPLFRSDDLPENQKAELTGACKKIITPENLAAQAPLIDYINKFKSCTPGSYTYKKNLGIINTVIYGFKNGKCILEGTLILGIGQETAKCAYSQASLDAFANSALEGLKQQSNPTESNSQKINPELINQLNQAFQECDKPWVPF